jgi:hypothetical protein
VLFQTLKNSALSRLRSPAESLHIASTGGLESLHILGNTGRHRIELLPAGRR